MSLERRPVVDSARSSLDLGCLSQRASSSENWRKIDWRVTLQKLVRALLHLSWVALTHNMNLFRAAAARRLRNELSKRGHGKGSRRILPFLCLAFFPMRPTSRTINGYFLHLRSKLLMAAAKWADQCFGHRLASAGSPAASNFSIFAPWRWKRPLTEWWVMRHRGCNLSNFAQAADLEPVHVRQPGLSRGDAASNWSVFR